MSRRKKDAICCIYQILNTVNGHSYVGQSSEFRERQRWHVTALRGGYHPNNHLQRAWDKYGEESFEFHVLEVIEPDPQFSPAERRNFLTPFEQAWMDQILPEYNQTTASGTCWGSTRTPEQCAKIGDALRGRTVSEETKAKIRAARKLQTNIPMKGGHHTDETKAKISAKLTGRKLPESHRLAIVAAVTGRECKPETRAKLRIAAKERHAAKLFAKEMTRLGCIIL